MAYKLPFESVQYTDAITIDGVPVATAAPLAADLPTLTAIKLPVAAALKFGTPLVPAADLFSSIAAPLNATLVVYTYKIPFTRVHYPLPGVTNNASGWLEAAFELDGSARGVPRAEGEVEVAWEMSGDARGSPHASGYLESLTEINATASIPIQGDGSLESLTEIGGSARTTVRLSGSLEAAFELDALGTVPILAYGELEVPLELEVDARQSTRHGDGEATMSMGASGTGRNLVAHASGALEISLEMFAEATNATVRGDGALEFSLEVEGDARMATLNASGDLEFTNEIQGLATLPTYGDGSLEALTEISGLATSTRVLRDGEATLNLSASGTGKKLDRFAGNIFLPPLTLEATMLTGGRIDGNVTLPLVVITATFGPPTLLKLPFLQLDGRMEAGQTLTMGNGILPALRLVGEALQLGDIEGACRLPILEMNATVAHGTVAEGAATLPMLQASGRIDAGQSIAGDITLPALTLDGVLFPQNNITSNIVLPMLEVDGWATFDPNLAVTGAAYSCNTEMGGVIPYDNFDFNELGFLQGLGYVGVKSDGLYLLDGADDDGTNIDAFIEFGITDFSEARGIDPEVLKRVIDAYVGYSATGDLLFTATLDGETVTRTYRLSRRPADTGLRARRVNFNRGDKSRYWKFKIANDAGADFEIDMIGWLVRALTRKRG